MSELLDREMPVEVVPTKSNNKKYLTLLLLLMIGFLLGIGSMAFLEEQKEAPVVQPPVVKPIPSNIPVASTTKPTDLNLAIENKNDTVQKTKKEEAVAKTISSNKNIAAKSIDVEKITNSIVTTTNHKDQKPTNESIPFHANEEIVKKPLVIYSEFYKKQRTIGKVVDKSLLNIENGKIVKSEIAAKIEKNKEAANSPNILPENLKKYLATIDILDLPKASMSELDSKERRVEGEFILPKKSRWRLAAIGGAHITSRFPGWEIGMLAEYQLNNPQFAIQSGLTIKSLKKETYLNQYDEISFDSSSIVTDPNFSSGTSNNTVGEEFANANQVYLEKLNYVNTPLLLSYQPTSFMKVLLGMNLAFRFNFIDNAIENVTNQSDNSDLRLIAAEGSQSSFDPGFTARNTSDGIRKMDVAGVLGIGFYPTKNTGIDLRYHLGFLDYTDDSYFTTGERHTNQSLQISLIHYFGK